MLLQAAAAVLALVLVTPAIAQEPTAIDLAMMTCVGSGFERDADRFAVLASLPEGNCKRACEANAIGCRAVARSVDRCGVSFLRAAAKVSIQACRGRGLPEQSCRGIHAKARADIDWWNAQGRIERAACDTEEETLCLSRCQAPAGVNYEDLVPTPLPERPDGQTGGAIVYLDWGAARQQILLREAPQGQEGARVIAVPGGELPSRVVDPRQGQAGTRQASTFVESENVSRFREIEPSMASESVSEIEIPEE